MKASVKAGMLGILASDPAVGRNPIRLGLDVWKSIVPSLLG